MANVGCWLLFIAEEDQLDQFRFSFWETVHQSLT